MALDPKATIDGLPRDDMGRITSNYDPSPLEIELARQAICREFGDNGTDGYYIRILKAIHAADALASRPSAIVEEPIGYVFKSGLDAMQRDRTSATVWHPSRVDPDDAKINYVYVSVYSSPQPHTGRAGVTEELLDAAKEIVEHMDGYGLIGGVDILPLRDALNAALTVEPEAPDAEKIEDYQFLASLQVGIRDCIGLDRDKLKIAKRLRAKGYVTIADSANGPMIELTEDGAVAALERFEIFAAKVAP